MTNIEKILDNSLVKIDYLKKDLLKVKKEFSKLSEEREGKNGKEKKQ